MRNKLRNDWQLFVPPYFLRRKNKYIIIKETETWHLINWSRRPAISWDAPLTQCRWWETGAWWLNCHLWRWRRPTPCRTLLQHWTAPSLSDWYTTISFCCCQTVQSALFPVDLTHYGVMLFVRCNKFTVQYYIYHYSLFKLLCVCQHIFYMFIMFLCL